MLVYPCSKVRHFPFWQALRAAGVPLVSPCWIDAEFNATGEDLDHDSWAAHWVECLSLASSCEITVFLAQEGELHAGALAELGACLSAGRQLFAVSAIDFSFLRHPCCRRFKTLTDAVAAVMAQQLGERERRYPHAVPTC